MLCFVDFSILDVRWDVFVSFREILCFMIRCFLGRWLVAGVGMCVF